MRRIRMPLFLGLVLSFSSYTATAQELPTLDEIIDKMAAAPTMEGAWSADMKMVMNVMGMSMELIGATTVSGNLSATTMSMNIAGMEMKTKTVLDSEGILWTETDAMGEMFVIKADIEQLAGFEDVLDAMGPLSGNGMLDLMQAPRKQMESFKEFYNLKVTGKETIDGEAVVTIEGPIRADAFDGAFDELDVIDSPMGSAMGPMADMIDESVSLSPIKFLIAERDGTVRAISIGDFNGKPMMEMTVSNLRLDINVDDSTFAYSPPEGVEVMDLANMANMAELGEPQVRTSQPEYNAKFSVGDIAPDFEGAGPDGTMTKLSSYRGKVVLLDFWATWCGPCIRELPNVIETYKEHHPNGLEIIGISLDDDRGKLESFLEEHPEMNWPQVFDGKGWGSAVGKQYGVDAIPFTLLLDGEGKIVARDLRGAVLANAVADLLAK